MQLREIRPETPTEKGPRPVIQQAFIKATGEPVQLGTASQLTQIRYDQTHLIETRQPNDTTALIQPESFHWRFPYPDEDGIAPGQFLTAERRWHIPGLPIPPGVMHNSVQVTNEERNWSVTVPCPVSPEATRLIGRDTELRPVESPGTPQIVRYQTPPALLWPVTIAAQRFNGYRLVLETECAGCGALWTYPDIDEVMPVIETLRHVAALLARPEPLRPQGLASFFLGAMSGECDAVADRITAGYLHKPSAVPARSVAS
ncbi:hypothetical protein LWF15_33435 [Kineosporia rhizophila]|uniref:hypothetical protein n=1 Tax=Kineosporia rhizophila TaxID=84633 RepID=UPI001E64D788|nr:hypothetical protein [Kineosporia rhizophila]MCE0540408.1 hypothetical protein [Kineosporia rhizophila]